MHCEWEQYELQVLLVLLPFLHAIMSSTLQALMLRHRSRSNPSYGHFCTMCRRFHRTAGLNAEWGRP